MNIKTFIYKGKFYNSNFDIYEIFTEIIPDYIDFKIFPNTFIITKIILLTFNNKIIRCYVNGNNYKVDLQTRLFNSGVIKNKKIDENNLSEIVKIISNELYNYDENKDQYLLKGSLISKINIKNDTFYFYNRKQFNLNFDIFEINKIIYPNKLIDYYDKQFSISYLPENFIISRIRIFTYNNRIYSIITDSPHPNSDIVDRNFCMPKNLLYQNIYQVGFKPIEELLKIYNIKNPYFHLPPSFEFTPINTEEIKCLNY